MATGDVSESVKGEYARRRALTFAGIVVGYATYYFTRLSFTYVSPLLLQDASLGLDMTSLGAITTVFPVFYAFSKFAGGVLGDATDARTIHALGLLITGTINIVFGCGSSLSWFAMCWALNGLFQVRLARLPYRRKFRRKSVLAPLTQLTKLYVAFSSPISITA
jgi:sugar phosphate permease